MIMRNHTENERNRTIDVIKGICILFVIITHYKWKDSYKQMLLFPFWIDMAIPVFMIITGYVNTLSFDQRKVNTLNNAYIPSNIFKKFLRYTIPFIPVYIFEVFLYIITQKKHYSIIKLVIDFIEGGYGPGSYYYPVLIQIILFFPLVWYIIKKYKGKGLLLFFVINLFYEIFKNIIGISDALYRLLAFRYLFNLSLGCYLSCLKQVRKQHIIAAIIGLFYLIIFNYTGINPFIMTKWTNTSMISVLFVFPVVKWIIDKNKLKNIVLESLGKASYNIFFAQMLYYKFFSKTIYKHLHGSLMQIAINIFICCSAGLLFYFIEKPITKWIVGKVVKE